MSETRKGKLPLGNWPRRWNAKREEHVLASLDLELDQPVTSDDVAKVLLHLLEAHEAAALALKVVDDAGETDKVLAAAGAMVELFLVYSRIFVLSLAKNSKGCSSLRGKSG